MDAPIDLRMAVRRPVGAFFLFARKNPARSQAHAGAYRRTPVRAHLCASVSVCASTQAHALAWRMACGRPADSQQCAWTAINALQRSFPRPIVSSCPHGAENAPACFYGRFPRVSIVRQLTALSYARVRVRIRIYAYAYVKIRGPPALEIRGPSSWRGRSYNTRRTFLYYKTEGEAPCRIPESGMDCASLPPDFFRCGEGCFRLAIRRGGAGRKNIYVFLRKAAAKGSILGIVQVSAPRLRETGGTVALETFNFNLKGMCL